MFNYEVFTLRLIELLESNNLTQRELAKRAEVEEATISRYINEHRQPRADVLIKIAEVLNTTTDYLVGKDPSRGIAEAPAVYETKSLNLHKKIDQLSEEKQKILETLIDSFLREQRSLNDDEQAAAGGKY
ncbi:MAG: helix-turn-helix domain-containing protein [Firmicutes bacterium]|nr:helix-turn-helix domain-containing protein [Bacillota bacterium]